MMYSDYDRLVADVCDNYSGIEFAPQVTMAMVEMKCGMYGAFAELLSECHSMDVDVIVDALGRIEFGMAWLRNLLLPLGGTTREDILDRSACKLQRFLSEN